MLVSFLNPHSSVVSYDIHSLGLDLGAIMIRRHLFYPLDACIHSLNPKDKHNRTGYEYKKLIHCFSLLFNQLFRSCPAFHVSFETQLPECHSFYWLVAFIGLIFKPYIKALFKAQWVLKFTPYKNILILPRAVCMP